MKGKKGPLPMKKMAPKKRNKASHMKEKEKAFTLHTFFGGFSMGKVERPETYALAPLPLVTHERK